MKPSDVLRIGQAAALAACFLLAASPEAKGIPHQPPEAKGTHAQPPEAKKQPTIIPEKFLRRWDPVTVFFPNDVGPSGGGPEDQPGRFASLAPVHPGAYTWLDAHTLQFRPAEPWPALARFTWRAGPRSVVLSTLAAAPLETIPADGSAGLDPVSEITLRFPEALETEALSRMLRIELRALPGIGDKKSRFLAPGAFRVKTVERASRAADAVYVLALDEPIPLGTRAILHLRLALQSAGDQSAGDQTFKKIAFATAEPFRVIAVGCNARSFPVTPEGSRYPRDQAIDCGAGERSVLVEFSAPPDVLGADLITGGRNLVRLTPAVEKLSFALEAARLRVTGNFAAETLYRVDIVPAGLADEKGRILEMSGPSQVFLHFSAKPAYLKWGAAHGIVERFGAQNVPVEGRGEERVDLRLVPIGALDRSFWPFPDRPVMVDESKRPPGPGEKPEPFTMPERSISASELAARIGSLDAAPWSRIVTLPLRREGSGAKFGLDLEPHLAHFAGTDQPGTYLAGIRSLGGASERAWMRVQVTDLALTAIEEPRAVRFAVTSLADARVLAGVSVRVEGTQREAGKTSWQTFFAGITGADGSVRWNAPGSELRLGRDVRRIVVEKGGDVLVLDATRPPERYADNHWSGGSAGSASRDTWLQWTQEALEPRGPQAETLCHIFTERPVYRPGDEVHIKGYLRHREKGMLSPERFGGAGTVVVEGPGDLAWRYPVELGEAASFHHVFHEESLPTGIYSAHFENALKVRFGAVSFSVEAYRLPTFEVELHGPDEVPLDREFEVSLTASYYAGGRVGGQPIAWRVTQFPYTWTPRAREGFLYSSDGRFSGATRFESSPRLEKEDTTSDEGAAALTLNPAIEPTAQPRSYVVEATVTGPDDQTVTATRRIQALPPFVLGLKVPRFIERAAQIEPAILVAGPDGKLIAGKEVTVRLLHRQWHSHLRASDFSDGVARYITDVVDEKVSETTVTSAKDPVTLVLPISKSGVYVVEIEAHDRLQRAQVVRADLYAGGDEPVAWSKPVSRVFSVASDKDSYIPGESASVVLESPFQNAQALAVIEAPEGNEYQWIAVAGGAATFRLPMRKSYVPRVPVHFILMRGRVPGAAPLPGNGTDLGKPATMAATAWLSVEPAENRVAVSLNYPDTARPGQRIDVTVKLADERGRPLSGEVTLWLVDQAVLALGKEQRLDPLPDFVTEVNSHLAARDTRNLCFGILPLAESPGGDGDAEEDGSLLDRATVRKNFKTVPYYNPAILVGPDGTVTVSVELSDDLTNFKLRAKAVSGPDRFGFAVGHLAVRLPVIVQPALPRFVRPGDRFTAAAIGRIVEGGGGAGSAEARFTGVTLEGPAKLALDWKRDRPERLEFAVAIPTPPYDEAGKLSYSDVTFRIGVERASDRAADAFEVRLPVRDDRSPVVTHELSEITGSAPLVVPAVAEASRPGTLRRSFFVSAQPGLVRMAAGLSFLLEYPYGCTEQRVSRARAEIALAKFRDLLRLDGAPTTAGLPGERGVRETLEWIASVSDKNGLVAYWPGADGYVSLTAWTVQFLVEARDAGFAVDPKLFAALTRSLEQALRSDYGRFIDGESFTERAWALAALAQAGKFDAAYAAELSRKAQFLNLEATAQVLQALARAPESSRPANNELAAALWDGIVVRLHQGREIYGGLQKGTARRNGLILPSETRTLAEVTRALVRHKTANPKLQILTDGLVTLGREDGWGDTNANAAALLALAEVLEPNTKAGPASAVELNRAVELKMSGKVRRAELGPASPAVHWISASPAGGEISAAAGNGAGTQGSKPVVVRSETSYIPAAPGNTVAPRADGLVVTRELLRYAKDNEPGERFALEQGGSTLAFRAGDVIEEHVQVVNSQERHYVAVVVPLAAGMEPLNPSLATAPPEAAPAGKTTLTPTYVAYLDDRVAYYFDTFPAGTHDFHFRTRAFIPGTFVQPPASAEMMYDLSVHGNSAGAAIEITRQMP